MVSQLLIDQKVAKGYAKAAQRTGSATTVYRATGPMAPMAGAPISTTLMAAFAKETSLTFLASLPWGTLIFTGMFDPTGMEVGDILQNIATTVDGTAPSSTYFIVRRDPFRPPLVVLTTNVADFYDTSQPAEWGESGVRPPSGPSKLRDVLVASGWPIAIGMTARGTVTDAKLPTDTRQAAYKVLCPAIPGINITHGRRIALPDGTLLRVEGAHISPFGWHFECKADSA